VIFTVALKDLRSLFMSPLAWAILAIVEAIVAYFFLIYLNYFVELQPRLVSLPNAPGVSNIVIAPLFSTIAIILLLVVPLLTMRMISEERRNKTLSLLISAPISNTQIILGKFLGVMGFFCVLLLLVTLMPVSLLLGGHIDFGLLSADILALLMLLCSFVALGLYISTLTAQPTIAAFGAFGALLLLWIINVSGKTGQETILGYLSLLNHYSSLLQGIVNTSDIIYYLLFTSVFLILSIKRLDTERLIG